MHFWFTIVYSIGIYLFYGESRPKHSNFNKVFIWCKTHCNYFIPLFQLCEQQQTSLCHSNSSPEIQSKGSRKWKPTKVRRVLIAGVNCTLSSSMQTCSRCKWIKDTKDNVRAWHGSHRPGCLWPVQTTSDEQCGTGVFHYRHDIAPVWVQSTENKKNRELWKLLNSFIKQQWQIFIGSSFFAVMISNSVALQGSQCVSPFCAFPISKEMQTMSSMLLNTKELLMLLTSFLRDNNLYFGLVEQNSNTHDPQSQSLKSTKPYIVN